MNNIKFKAFLDDFRSWFKQYKSLISIGILSVLIHVFILFSNWINWGTFISLDKKTSPKLVKAQLVANHSNEKKLEETSKNQEDKTSDTSNTSKVEESKPVVSEPKTDQSLQQEIDKFTKNNDVPKSETANNIQNNDHILTSEHKTQNTIDIPKENKEEPQDIKENSKISDNNTEHNPTMNGIKVPKKVQQNQQATKQLKNGLSIPLNLNLTFNIMKGDDDFTIGQAIYIVKFDPEHQKYSIESTIQTKGVFAIISSGVINQKSYGVLGEHGLKPTKFESTKTNREQIKSEIAEFDWQNKQIHFKFNSEPPKTVELSDGTQDALSLLYQFSFEHAQTNQIKVNLVNGHSVEQYLLKVYSDKTLKINNKSYDTIYFEKIIADGGDKTEIWIDKNQHYLPIKVRQTDKKGSVMSFVLDSIQELK